MASEPGVLTDAMLREAMRYVRDTKPPPVDYPPGINFDDYMRFVNRLEAEFGEDAMEVERDQE